MKLQKKLRKQLILPAAVLLATIVVVGVVLAQPNPPQAIPKSVASMQHTVASSTDITPVDATPVLPTEQTVATQTPTTEPAPTPTPDQNKATIMAQITQYTQSKGMTDLQTYAQTHCIDVAISNGPGYANYNVLEDATQFPLLSEVLTGKLTFSGSCMMSYH